MKRHECSADCYYYRHNIKHPGRLTERQREIVREKLRGMGRDWYLTSSIVKRLAARFRVSEGTIYRASKRVRIKKLSPRKSIT